MFFNFSNMDKRYIMQYLWKLKSNIPCPIRDFYPNRRLTQRSEIENSPEGDFSQYEIQLNALMQHVFKYSLVDLITRNVVNVMAFLHLGKMNIIHAHVQ